MKRWKSGLALAGALALVTAYVAFISTRGDISGDRARQLVDDGALLLDVRSSAEFAAGHLPGAVNVPVSDLARRAGDLAPRDRPIVVYCMSGSRSARAARVLEGAGYGAVHDLGSISRW
jgi:rhodanese-related sulfurtransferase